MQNSQLQSLFEKSSLAFYNVYKTGVDLAQANYISGQIDLLETLRFYLSNNPEQKDFEKVNMRNMIRNLQTSKYLTCNKYNSNQQEKIDISKASDSQLKLHILKSIKPKYSKKRK